MIAGTRLLFGIHQTLSRAEFSCVTVVLALQGIVMTDLHDYLILFSCIACFAVLAWRIHKGHELEKRGFHEHEHRADR